MGLPAIKIVHELWEQLGLFVMQYKNIKSKLGGCKDQLWSRVLNINQTLSKCYSTFFIAHFYSTYQKQGLGMNELQSIKYIERLNLLNIKVREK